MQRPTYPVDLIAQRDEKDRLARTVIKWWNVNFIYPDQVKGEVEIPQSQEEPVPQQEAEPELTDEQKALIAQANEVFARLEEEKALDEAAKQAEIEAAYAAYEESIPGEEHYNAATGSYSGVYGKGYVSEETKDLAASIMAEKSDALNDLIEIHKVE